MDSLGLETEIGAWDSVLLEPLSEDSFVANLHQRFKRDQIYTYIGNVLVSVNPYKKLAIYSGELARAYRTRGPHQLPPHVYAVTGAAYRFLRDRNEDQAIVVCGESGSGKTEAARIALQFLAYSPFSVASSNSTHKTHRISIAPAVRDGLLQAGLLLEAFGNAKTYRNDNSSRFGKYMDIEFDYKGDPLGGTITNYLLEKSRVTHHSQGERNFHIFYQLLTGADIATLKALKLQRNVDKYVYLQSPSTHPTPPVVDAIDDKRDFQLTKHALECLGFCPDQQQQLFRIVAAVLKLGNLGFIPTNNIDGTEGCSIINEYELHEVCHLLGTQMSCFSSALTQRKLLVQCAPPSPRTRRKDQSASSPSKCSREICEVCELTCCDMGLLRAGSSENVITELSAYEASNARDTLCKALYSRLFTWLVNAINESTKVKTYGRRRVLAILDIYGFEILEKNGFDQLLINLCNEKLHQVVLQSTLKGEQEEYLRENIEWCSVEFYDNVNVCELLEKCNKGIISLLDEEGVRSDEEFLNHLSQASGHRGLLATSADNNMPANSFRLKHYAGTVTYSVSGFIDKNTEGVPRDVSQALYCCDHSLLQALFPEGNPHRSCLKKPASTGSQFRLSLGALIRNLNTKHLHFVRCIKPNELKQPRIFELALVQHQVRYLSLIETVRLRRSGFCHSLTYQQFLGRYKMLSLHTWPKWRGPPVEGVSYLVNDLPIPTGEFAFGRTKIFVRSPRSVFELEEFRRNRLQDLAILVQKIWRGYHQKKEFQKMRQSQIIIASAWRSWRECRFGIPFDGRRHLWCLYRVAREEYRILKHKKQVEWAINIIQIHYINWKKREFLYRLACCLPPECESPICRDWPSCPRRLSDSSMLLRRIYHKWRCHKYRLKFDQTSRNRMREKVTASLIFKERKASYPRSVSHPFLGDYVRLRQNVQWKKACVETNDQYVVFADIINKITRSSGKFVPILFVLSTSSMLILDQRTLQIKYRVPATEIYRLSLSPFLDDVAVFHVRAPSPTSDTPSQPIVPGCLFQSDLGKKKGDFVFQTGHVIEIVTKLFLVVQNAIGKPPEVNISTEFEANFGQQSVTFTFKCLGLPEVPPGQIRILRKANKMEVLV